MTQPEQPPYTCTVAVIPEGVMVTVTRTADGAQTSEVFTDDDFGGPPQMAAQTGLAGGPA